MDNAGSRFGELKQMRENICRSVNSLELCWGCDRICECERWLINESLPVWLCHECLVEVSCNLEKRSGVPVSLIPA